MPPGDAGAADVRHRPRGCDWSASTVGGAPRKRPLTTPSPLHSSAETGPDASRLPYTLQALMR